MSCNSFNVIYVLVACSGCLRRVYRQQIKQPEHQKLKVEEHIRICGRDSFKIFSFLQMRSNDTNLRAHETKFQREYKTKLNQLKV